MTSDKRDNHKYVARIAIGTKAGRTQYRYFYDQASYSAYLKQAKSLNTNSGIKSKTTTTSTSKTKKSAVSKTSKTTNKLDANFSKNIKDLGKKLSKNNPAIKQFAKDTKALKEMIKNYTSSKQSVSDSKTKKAESNTKADQKRTFVTEKKVEPKKASEIASKKSDKKLNHILSDALKTKKSDSETSKAIKNKLNEVINKTLDDVRKQKEQQSQQKESAKNEVKTTDKPVKSDNTSGKSVTLPNGTTKQFSSIDEYNDYQARLEYQKNSPEFMSKIPKIPGDIVHSKMEDMEKINEKYDPQSDEYSRNCSNCSVAYELRRRGYDVEAKPRDDTYNGKRDRFYDYFENAKVVGIAGDGSSVTYDERYVRDCADKDGKVSLKNDNDKKTYDLDKNDQTYTAASIEKGILDNSPPGSRGFISVSWKAGSAHSIMYEVDSKGKVTIRDSQTYDEYELDELADRVKKVSICRSDNLQIKEDILNAVQVNADNEREYYVDKRTAYRYKK